MGNFLKTTATIRCSLIARCSLFALLLGELARKSQQAESIDDIGELLSDMDERMSDRLDDRFDRADCGR